MTTRRNQFITLIFQTEDTDLLNWYNKHKTKGVNMSALIRDTLRKGIAASEPPQWFLDFMRNHNHIQPSISDKIDMKGLWEDE